MCQDFFGDNMNYFLIAVPVWIVSALILGKTLRIAKKPAPSPVKALCHHCYQFHDGPMMLCEACEWPCFPDGLVQEEVREQIDNIQYRTQGAE
jgi:hypothetical protein